MASGSFSSSILDGHYKLQVNWSESEASSATNKSKVSISCYLVNDWELQVGDRTLSATINGVAKSWTTTNGGVHGTGTTYLGGTYEVVTHNADGSKKVTISVTYPINATISGVYYANITATKEVTLDTIPRYAVVNINETSKTETTSTYSWTSDLTVSYIWYKLNDSTTWVGVDIADGTSGTLAVSGLTPNLLNDIHLCFRAKDSGLDTYLDIQCSTYSYPYASVMPDFEIGDELTVTIYNPLSRWVYVTLVGDDDSDIVTYNIGSTSCSGFNTTLITKALYETIPNAQSGQYKIRVDYGQISSITETGGEYSIKPNDCAPHINSVDYNDVLVASLLITGNSKKVVRNRSKVLFSATGLSARLYATVASCSLEVNGATYAMTINGTSASVGDIEINSGTSVVATFTVTDSRGVTGTKTITVDMVNWQPPTGILTVKRHNNFYSDTDIKCDAQYTIIGTNAITITYEAHRDDGGGSAITGTLTDNVTSVVTLDNNYAWNIGITITDSFNGTVTYLVYLSRGTPIIFFDRVKSSVGINCFPKEDLAFDINDIEYALTPADYLEIATLLALPYSSTTAYKVGDFVTESGSVYECNQNCTAGTWANNSSKFTLLGGI